MDTSPEYVKQCEKAEEIQKGHELEEPDYFSTDGVKVESFCYEYQPDAGIWLPRQDQLQDMIRLFPDVKFMPVHLVEKIHKFMFTDYAEYTCLFGSMEQLWLAFYMKEQYEKSWTGTEWVKG